MLNGLCVDTDGQLTAAPLVLLRQVVTLTFFNPADQDVQTELFCNLIPTTNMRLTHFIPNFISDESYREKKPSQSNESSLEGHLTLIDGNVS